MHSSVCVLCSIFTGPVQCAQCAQCVLTHACGVCVCVVLDVPVMHLCICVLQHFTLSTSFFLLNVLVLTYAFTCVHRSTSLVACRWPTPARTPTARSSSSPPRRPRGSTASTLYVAVFSFMLHATRTHAHSDALAHSDACARTLLNS